MSGIYIFSKNARWLGSVQMGGLNEPAASLGYISLELILTQFRIIRC